MTEQSGVDATSVAHLHIVVTCTNRKRFVPPVPLRASSLPLGSLAERFSAWTDALESVSAKRVVANELYTGDQWFVARSIGSNAPPGIRISTWVVSAGYGLIRPDAWLKPYAATFAAGHTDSVIPRGAPYSSSDWWRALGAWNFDSSGAPRTISALASCAGTNKDAFVLVAASESYAAAMMVDLYAAAEVLPDRLALISVGLQGKGRGHPEQPINFLMPGEAKLQSIVGGATHSLNARLACRAVIEAPQWIASAARLRNLMREWLDTTPPALRYDRNRMNDAEVRIFITKQLDRNPTATRTALLRALRSSGHACEQARFSVLFREAASSGRASCSQPLGELESGA
jgi:hypothetical protein